MNPQHILMSMSCQWLVLRGSSAGTGRPEPCCRCPLAPRGLWLKMLKRRWGHHMYPVDARLSDEENYQGESARGDELGALGTSCILITSSLIFYLQMLWFWRVIGSVIYDVEINNPPFSQNQYNSMLLSLYNTDCTPRWTSQGNFSVNEHFVYEDDTQKRWAPESWMKLWDLTVSEGQKADGFTMFQPEKEAKLMTCERRNGMPGELEMDDANFCVPSTRKSRVHVCDGKLLAKQVIGRHCALEMLVIFRDVLLEIRGDDMKLRLRWIEIFSLDHVLWRYKISIGFLCIQSIIRLKVLFINLVAQGLHFRSYFHHFSVSTNQPDHPPHHLSTNSW